MGGNEQQKTERASVVVPSLARHMGADDGFTAPGTPTVPTLNRSHRSDAVRAVAQRVAWLVVTVGGGGNDGKAGR